jgi:hypothetical protein
MAMSINPYVVEKLSELEETRSRRRNSLVPARPSGRRPLVAPLARTAGRRLRTLGARLEAWGTPLTESEARPKVAGT